MEEYYKLEVISKKDFKLDNNIEVPKNEKIQVNIFNKNRVSYNKNNTDLYLCEVSLEIYYLEEPNNYKYMGSLTTKNPKDFFVFPEDAEEKRVYKPKRAI